MPYCSSKKLNFYKVLEIIFTYQTQHEFYISNYKNSKEPRNLESVEKLLDKILARHKKKVDL